MAKTNLAHLKRLIGNPDVYATQNKDGTWNIVKAKVTDSVLRAHLNQTMTVGTYVVKPPDQARTLVFDVDDESVAKAKLYAFDIQEGLRKFGVPDRSIGVEFSGKKGYHVWVPLWDYAQAATLRHLGRVVSVTTGIDCEVFPKQDRVAESGFGNLVKLPGGVHQVTGNPNEYLLRSPQPMSLAVFERILKKLPALPELRTTGERPVPLECMANIQAGVGEGMRNHALFQFCAHARRASLDETLVREIAHAVNQRFNPPLDGAEVESVLQSSRDKGPVCRNLPPEVRCEDCPILREKGLYTKPGQVQNAAEGELVVVEVGSKDKGRVELKHPDVGTALGFLS